MNIAIPLAAGRLSAHFGHCDQFAILEVDQQNKTVTNTTLHEAPGHEPGALPRWLNEQGADVIIAGGMGRRAQQLFAQNGSTVVVGAPSDTPEATVQAYLAGTIETMDNICDH